MQVPANLALAVKSRESADRDAAERAEMKRLVLEAGDRDDGGVLPLPKVVQPRTAVKQPGGGHRGHGHPSRGGPTSASRSSHPPLPSSYHLLQPVALFK